MAKESFSGKTLLARLATEEERKTLAGDQFDVVLTEPIDIDAYVEVDVLPLKEDMEKGTFYITPDGEASFVANDKIVTLLPETEINEKLSHLISIEVVEELPEIGNEHTLYLVPLEDPEQQDVFDEYIWQDGSYEKIGNTRIDLSNYYTKEEIDAITSANLGKPYKLTAEDYNYHVTGAVDNRIALWKLSPGFYYWESGFSASVMIDKQTLNYAFTDARSVIITKDPSVEDRVVMVLIGDTARSYQDEDGSYNCGAVITYVSKDGETRTGTKSLSINVLDSLSSTDMRSALSANQGRVLKGLIDENIGSIKLLTAADYNANSNNWSDTNPANFNCIATWLLPTGIYKTNSGPQVWYSKSHTIGNQGVVWMINSSLGEQIWLTSSSLYSNRTSSLGSESVAKKVYLTTDGVIDNLTSYAPNAPLSANQGRVLKGLIDSIPKDALSMEDWNALFGEESS